MAPESEGLYHKIPESYSVSHAYKDHDGVHSQPWELIQYLARVSVICSEL